MPSDDIAISIRNLTKSYRLFGHPGDRIKQFFSLGLKQYHRKFTALNDVSFDIKKGETVGIIGRNGSGKSTLLQLICGILKPTSGTVQVTGRVSALLELGAGFNPEFTGRENVYFQGAIMGFTATQMEERFEAIASFAEIGEFIDQPVRTYSSGMFVRLAFAVAISVDPDILVVDEALSVGDGRFQLKCAAWLQKLRQKQVTVLLVSHDESVITSLCDKVIVLEGGRKIMDGEPRAMSAAYHQLLFGNPGTADGTGQAASPQSPSTSPDDQRPSPGSSSSRYGTGEANLVAWGIRDQHGRSCSTIESGTPFRLYMVLEFHSDVPDVSYGFVIKNRRGTTVWGVTSILQGQSAHHGHTGEEFVISADGIMNLAGSAYFVTLGAAHLDDGRKIDFIDDALEFQVVGPGGIFDASVVNLQTEFAITPKAQSAT
jgi:ABC-type polysaccharide/polyol phosphate transport system ATPase subunit